MTSNKFRLADKRAVKRKAHKAAKAAKKRNDWLGVLKFAEEYANCKAKRYTSLYRFKRV